MSSRGEQGNSGGGAGEGQGNSGGTAGEQRGNGGGTAGNRDAHRGRTSLIREGTRRGAKKTFVHGGHGGARRTANCFFCPRRTRRGTENCFACCVNWDSRGFGGFGEGERERAPDWLERVIGWALVTGFGQIGGRRGARAGPGGPVTTAGVLCCGRRLR